MKSILVCLDGSKRAPFVLETAADLAQRTGAKLRLFRAVGLPPEIDQEVVAHSAMTMVETLLGKARRELAEIAKPIPPALIEATDVRIGVPWDAVCREAKDHDCDLIVIGSHGYSGLDRILGTTAAKIVNHADRSVLVARPRA
jgi:nucleotide-binding universal stress UspA family protein